jgi:hypothetical protein
MSPSYLSLGPIGPAVVNNDIFQMPEELDPSLWHPNYMRLHGWWEILDLGHGNCTSECGEVPLHPSQNSLSLSSWRSPCGCWSVNYCCWYCLWSRMFLVLEKSIGCTGPTSVHNRYIVVNTLMHIKMIYIKETKN